MSKLINKNGQVAVLYSRDYGEGWSTEVENSLKKFFMFDAGLVQLVRDKSTIVELQAYLEQKSICIAPYNDEGLVPLVRDKSNTTELLAQLEQKGVCIVSYNIHYSWENIGIRWVDQGVRFRIEEYDGKEYFVFPEQDTAWYVA